MPMYAYQHAMPIGLNVARPSHKGLDPLNTQLVPVALQGGFWCSHRSHGARSGR